MIELSPQEEFWRDMQPWLLSRGYQLRARYQPNWVPSWVTDPPPYIGKMFQRKDYLLKRISSKHATRIVDNKQVVMKRIASIDSGYNFEHYVARYVSSPENLQDPDNNCVPILETMQAPGDDSFVIIVMPLLRPFDSPRFDTIGECLDFFLQIFKGIQFLHRHHIAHRDCTGLNLMMDGSQMYPAGFHPIKHDSNKEYTGSAVQKYTRTQRTPRYYWIDFGLSVPFDENVRYPRVKPIHGGDKSVPEHRGIFKYPELVLDPFATDIYYLGSLVRSYFTEGNPDYCASRKFGFDFMKPLVAAMVQEDPAKRPNIDQCVCHLQALVQSQTCLQLRAQVWHSTDNPFGFIYHFFPHWMRRIGYVITRTPAIPSLTRRKGAGFEVCT